MVAVESVVTTAVVIVKFALVSPARTITLAGTDTRLVGAAESATTAPPVGAGSWSVTIPCRVVPPETVPEPSVTRPVAPAGALIQGRDSIQNAEPAVAVITCGHDVNGGAFQGSLYLRKGQRRIVGFEQPAIAAAWGAAALVPEEGEKPLTEVVTPSAAVMSGLLRTAPPVDEKFPGVIGVPSALKNTRRGPSLLKISTTLLELKTLG